MNLPIHDTHVHLDLLLHFLEILPEIRTVDDHANFDLTPELGQKCQTIIDKHLENHRLAIQSTISTKNFEFIHKILPAKNNPKLKVLLGTHPEEVDFLFNLKQYLDYQNNFLNSDEAKNLPFVGIGEVGLDYHYTQDKNLIQTQKELFESQIELAIKLDTALVIHCREAFVDLIEILKLHPKIHGKFLIHCFTGDTDIMKQILNMGGLAAYGGIITFGSSADSIRDSLKYCPNDGFVLETDLPFLAPAPHRSKTNIPEFINLVAQKASEIRQQPLENIWQNSWENTTKLFRI